jgi:hypothetical protein
MIGQEIFCEVLQGLQNLFSALFAKWKIFIISLNLSLHITSPNPEVGRPLVLEKYVSRVGF